MIDLRGEIPGSGGIVENTAPKSPTNKDRSFINRIRDWYDSALSHSKASRQVTLMVGLPVVLTAAAVLFAKSPLGNLGEGGPSESSPGNKELASILRDRDWSPVPDTRPSRPWSRYTDAAQGTQWLQIIRPDNPAIVTGVGRPGPIDGSEDLGNRNGLISSNGEDIAIGVRLKVEAYATEPGKLEPEDNPIVALVLDNGVSTATNPGDNRKLALILDPEDNSLKVSYSEDAVENPSGNPRFNNGPKITACKDILDKDGNASFGMIMSQKVNEGIEGVTILCPDGNNFGTNTPKGFWSQKQVFGISAFSTYGRRAQFDRLVARLFVKKELLRT